MTSVTNHLVDTVHCRSFASQVMSSLQEERDFMRTKNLRKNYSKLSNRKVHLVNMIAERAQTLSMFKDSLKRLTGFLKSANSLKKSALRYALNPKKFANDFLAFKFGVEPLIGDVKGISEQLAQMFLETESDDLYIVVRSNTTKFVSINRLGLEVKGRLVSSLVWKYKILPNSDAARALQSIGGLNISETLFEVAPWSFVLDWLIPISKYLEAMSADVGLAWKSGTRTESFVGKVLVGPNLGYEVHRTRPPFVDGEIVHEAIQTLSSGIMDVDIIKREVLSEPQAADVLTVESPFSWTHGFEALALIVQRFR